MKCNIEGCNLFPIYGDRCMRHKAQAPVLMPVLENGIEALLTHQCVMYSALGMVDLIKGYDIQMALPISMRWHSQLHAVIPDFSEPGDIVSGPIAGPLHLRRDGRVALMAYAGYLGDDGMVHDAKVINTQGISKDYGDLPATRVHHYMLRSISSMDAATHLYNLGMPTGVVYADGSVDIWDEGGSYPEMDNKSGDKQYVHAKFDTISMSFTIAAERGHGVASVRMDMNGNSIPVLYIPGMDKYGSPRCVGYMFANDGNTVGEIGNAISDEKPGDIYPCAHGNTFIRNYTAMVGSEIPLLRNFVFAMGGLQWEDGPYVVDATEVLCTVVEGGRESAFATPVYGAKISGESVENLCKDDELTHVAARAAWDMASMYAILEEHCVLMWSCPYSNAGWIVHPSLPIAIRASGNMVEVFRIPPCDRNVDMGVIKNVAKILDIPATGESLIRAFND